MAKKKKRRRRLKWGNIFIAIILCLVVIIGIVFVVKEFILTDDSSNKNVSKVGKDETEESEKTYTASMITAGDNLIHSSLYKDANKNANYDGYDFKPMYELIKPIVEPYDIAYYNQETILGGTELGLSDYPTFNSPQEVGDAMIDAGFNLVSLATNHTIDSGEKAILA